MDWRARRLGTVPRDVNAGLAAALRGRSARRRAESSFASGRRRRPRVDVRLARRATMRSRRSATASSPARPRGRPGRRLPVRARRRRRAARSVLALSAGRDQRPVARRRHVRVLDRRRAAAAHSTSSCSTSCTSARSPPRGRSTRRSRTCRRSRELGVTAIELMPVATFPGERGWGYDGVYLYAPHPAYGGPDGLARLRRRRASRGPRRAARRRLQPHRPRLGGDRRLRPVLHRPRTTRSGASAIDYSQRGVREWAIGNAIMWTRDYRHRRPAARRGALDLRRRSPVHVLRELRERVDGLVIERDGPRRLPPARRVGTRRDVARQPAPRAARAPDRRARRATTRDSARSTALVRELTRPAPERLIVAAQNHDQIGNRALGDRLPPDAHRVALAVVLFSLNTPLLFMGEEHDERAPFQFFTDHIDPVDRRRDARGTQARVRRVHVVLRRGGARPAGRGDRARARVISHPRAGSVLPRAAAAATHAAARARRRDATAAC